MANDLTQVQEFKWLAEMSIDAGDFEDASAGGREAPRPAPRQCLSR